MSKPPGFIIDHIDTYKTAHWQFFDNHQLYDIIMDISFDIGKDFFWED